VYYSTAVFRSQPEAVQLLNRVCTAAVGDVLGASWAAKVMVVLVPTTRLRGSDRNNNNKDNSDSDGAGSAQQSMTILSAQFMAVDLLQLKSEVWIRGG
jgi:hypothetical protein